MRVSQRFGLCRGFVGPLGDDLPSIFPIVTAVLLFVGTIFYANQVVDQKNAEIGLRQSVLSLSYLMTEKGLLIDRNEFKKNLCEEQLKKSASSGRVYFLVTVKKYCKRIEFFTPGVSPPFFSPFFLEETNELGVNAQGHTFAFCTNQLKNGQPYDIKRDKPVDLSKPFPVPEDAVTIAYPIAVRCEIDNFPTNGMGMIFVTGWK